MKGGRIMARPITPTPKLDVKSSRKFLRDVEKNLTKPARLVPTPKLSEAKKLVKQYALKRAE
jgi:hypothetical protein